MCWSQAFVSILCQSITMLNIGKVKFKFLLQEERCLSHAVYEVATGDVTSMSEQL